MKECDLAIDIRGWRIATNGSMRGNAVANELLGSRPNQQRQMQYRAWRDGPMKETAAGK